jgi:hypothetical protein
LSDLFADRYPRPTPHGDFHTAITAIPAYTINRRTLRHEPAVCVVEWRAPDPLAVHLTVARPGVTTGPAWLLGRDFLATGLDHPVGEMDAHLRPAGGRYAELTLQPPDARRFVIYVDRIRLFRFLAGTYRRVPSGPDEVAALGIPDTCEEFLAATEGDDTEDL